MDHVPITQQVSLVCLRSLSFCDDCVCEKVLSGQVCLIIQQYCVWPLCQNPVTGETPGALSVHAVKRVRIKVRAISWENRIVNGGPRKARATSPCVLMQVCAYHLCIFYGKSIKAKRGTLEKPD